MPLQETVAADSSTDRTTPTSDTPRYLCRAVNSNLSADELMRQAACHHAIIRLDPANRSTFGILPTCCVI